MLSFWRIDKRDVLRMPTRSADRRVAFGSEELLFGGSLAPIAVRKRVSLNLMRFRCEGQCPDRVGVSQAAETRYQHSLEKTRYKLSTERKRLPSHSVLWGRFRGREIFFESTPTFCKKVSRDSERFRKTPIENPTGVFLLCSSPPGPLFCQRFCMIKPLFD